MKLWTSFISLRRLNIESLSCEDGELDDISLFLILVKIEGLCSFAPFNLWKIKVSKILSCPILLNTKKHYRDADGYNLSNTDVFG